MAIASVLLNVMPEDMKGLEKQFNSFSCLTDCKKLPESSNFTGFAAVIEAPAGDLTEKMKELASLPEVIELQLVFADYEDDLDDSGQIDMPLKT